MTSAKTVILTAIANKGAAAVRANAADLADDLFCSKAHVLNICKKVENEQIEIVRAA